MLIIHHQCYKWKSKWESKCGPGCQGSDVACQINKGGNREISVRERKKKLDRYDIDRLCLCFKERQTDLLHV